MTVLVAALALLAGCGDDDDAAADGAGDDATQDDGATTDADAGAEDDDAGDEAATLPDECPDGVPFEVELRADGDGAPEAVEIVDAVALRRAEGRALTVYLATFDIDDDTSWALVTPDVPPGGLLVSTGLDHFNADIAEIEPLAVGASGPLFGEAGDGATATFLNMQGEAAGSTSVSQEGTSTLLHVDDDRVCLEVDITSESGAALSGVYTAPIVAEI